MNELPALVRVFAYLSLLTVGDGMAAFPEMKTLTVDVHAWLTSSQLVVSCGTPARFREGEACKALRILR
jgi:hypothetical protein